MRSRYIAALLLAGVLPLTACEGGATSSDKPDAVVTETATSEPADDTADAAPEDDAEEVTMPDFVGMQLQEAQDTAQAKGLFMLTSHDSTGAGRMQVLDRNWQVCTQDPAAGATVSTDVEVDFGTVKTDESCP